MIKANEIRVGNWLNDPRPLTEFNKKYVNNPDNGYFIATARDIQFAEEFEPITLTEEILLKCGFKKTEEYYAADEENVDVYTIGCFDIAFIDNEYKLWISIDEDSYYNFAWTEIKYLHQLQNLYFSLTGQELEVNL